MHEWVIEQYARSLAEFGLKKPWYWDQFLDALEIYHHRVYASAYTHRATVWFDMVVPGPAERAWLAAQYPKSWPAMAPVWEQIDQRWRDTDAGVEWWTQGATPVGFCDLCQLVLSNGTAARNSARTLAYGGAKYIFCSEPCEWIFRREPERYAGHRDVVKRILAGEAPANMLELTRRYFELDEQTRGKDVCAGRYPWIARGRGGADVTGR
jgi:toluene monooxygenase system protein A